MSPADDQFDNEQDPPTELGDGERREAFARLFAKHDRWLFSYLVVLLGNPADAEEVFQEVCVVLWREHEKFQLGTDFVKWVSVIANNQVHRFRNKSRRKNFPLDEQLLGAVAEAAVGRADIFESRREALRSCLRKLSRDDRQIVQQCYDHETRNFKTAAERLGRPVNTVYKALNRIRRMLHSCIDSKLATEGLQ
ncbi:MAG: sigma-70 family RNA polymerase sigma factor [Planctomycetota bacterium]